MNVDKCPHFSKCQERQIYDENGQPDKKAGFDHMNDAGTYPIAFMFPVKIKQDPIEINPIPTINRW